MRTRTRKSVAAIAVGVCLVAAGLTIGTAGANHDVGNPTWNQGYALLIKCGGDENVSVVFRHKYAVPDDFLNATDQRVHVFLRDFNGPRAGVPLDLGNHYNVPADNIISSKAVGGSSWSVLHQGVFPSSQIRLDWFYVENGDGATDESQILSIDCIPKTHADSTTFAVDYGDQTVLH